MLSVAPVPAVGVTLLVLALWLIQGIGWVRCLMPSLREHAIAEWVIATWLGALVSLVVAVELYYAIPGATAGQLAWPVTVALAAASLVLYVRSGWTRPRFDALGIGIVAITALGTLLVLRPLIGHVHLAFYDSNNGEFSNYAAVADAAQFHDSATSIGGLGLHSREAVGGLSTAVIAQLVGTSALWVIQPVAAAMAALAFAALGLAIRHVARAFELRWPAALALALVYAWAVLSASAQCFFTLSFVSQYLCVALWFGALACLLELPRDADRARTIVLGGTLGTLACVYPEMIAPSAGLLCAFELAAVPSKRTIARLAIAAAIAAAVANRLGYELVLGRLGVGAGGWNIYGNSHPAFGFFAALTGFTNPFSGPGTPHVATAGLAALGFAAALVVAVVTAGRERRAGIRGLSHLAWLFAAGIAGIFWIVARRGDGNNYVALKLVLGFGWLGYLALAVALARLAAWQPRLGYAALGFAVVVCGGLAHGAYRFTKQLYRARATALYDARDAAACRTALAGAPHAYVASSWFNLHIIGMFVAYDRDLVTVAGHWPDVGSQQLAPNAPVLAVAGFDLAKDPRLVGISYTVAWTGAHLALLRPVAMPPRDMK